MDRVKTGPGFWSLQSVRLRIGLLLAIGFAVHSTIRGVLGMALVCIVKPENQYQNQTLIANRSFQVDWNLREISAIFMFYYVGTFLVVSSICTMTIPILIYWNDSYVYTSMSRFITGIAQGFYIPSASMLIAKWFAENERSSAMAVFTTGNQLGLAVSMFFTAELCKFDTLHGWPLSFIIYGALGIIFLLLWIPYASDQPRQSPQITAVELSLIRDKHNNSEMLSSFKHDIPYTKILFSPVVLSICLSSFCQTFAMVIVYSYLPTLYRSALNLNLTENALWTAIPFVLQIVSRLIFGFLADLAKSRYKLDVDFVTKLSNGIASFVPAILFLMIGFSEDKLVTLLLLSSGMVFTSGYVAGYHTAIVTISPIFTSAISSYAQGFAQIGSIIAPVFVGFATSESTLEEWLIIFRVMSAILIFTGIIFILFGSARIQNWAQLDNLRNTMALKSVNREMIVQHD